MQPLFEGTLTNAVVVDEIGALKYVDTGWMDAFMMDVSGPVKYVNTGWNDSCETTTTKFRKDQHEVENIAEGRFFKMQ